MWHLLVLSFVIGIFTVFFDVAYQSYLPSLVEREQLMEGNSKLQLTVSITQVAGPSASGGLIAAITAPYAIFVDAISFLVSTIFMVRMRHRETMPEHAQRRAAPEDVARREGRPALGRRPPLAARDRHVHRASNFFGRSSSRSCILYFTRRSTCRVRDGLVFAVGAIGSIVGALVVNRLQQAIGVGPTIVDTAVAFSARRPRSTRSRRSRSRCPS